MTLTSKTPYFKSKFITAELAHLFSQSDSEEEFVGFGDCEQEDDGGCSKKQVKVQAEDSGGSDEDTGFYSDEEATSTKRRSLLVALRFPIKRHSSPRQRSEGKSCLKKEEPAPRKASVRQKRKPRQSEDDDTVEREEDVLSQSLKKRDKNIAENKAMVKKLEVVKMFVLNYFSYQPISAVVQLAMLFADLSSMTDLALPITPQKKKKRESEKLISRKRKSEVDVGSERRNPSRKARPPEHFAVEEKSDPAEHRVTGPRRVDIRRLVEVDGERVSDGKRKRSQSSRRSQYVVKSVDEITQEDLDNIAYRSKDKIWDKETGSSCHQCRQKTLDTKTVCRSGFCVGAKGQFCGPCLKNRYGEDVSTVLLDPTWSCPLCRGMCNCSLCRKKEGRCATGILVGLARYNGHDNVHEYLASIQKELQQSPEK